MEDHDVRAAMLGEPFTMSGLRQLQPSRVRRSGRPLTVVQIELEQLFSAKW